MDATTVGRLRGQGASWRAIANELGVGVLELCIARAVQQSNSVLALERWPTSPEGCRNCSLRGGCAVVFLTLVP